MSELRDSGIIENENGEYLALDYIPLDTLVLKEGVERFFIGMDLQNDPEYQTNKPDTEVQNAAQEDTADSEDYEYFLGSNSRIKDALDVATNRWWTVEDVLEFYSNPHQGVLQSRFIQLYPVDDDRNPVNISLDTGMITLGEDQPSAYEVEEITKQLVRLELYSIVSNS